MASETNQTGQAGQVGEETWFSMHALGGATSPEAEIEAVAAVSEDALSQEERARLNDAKTHGWARGRTRNPVLALLTALLAAWVTSFYWADLTYFFSPSEPLRLGDADKIERAALRDDTFVELTGFTTNKAADVTSGVLFWQRELRFYRLASAPIIIARPRDAFGSAFPFYQKVTVRGRLRALAQDGHDKQLARHFTEYFAYDFVKDPHFVLREGDVPRENVWPLVSVVAMVVLFLLNLLAAARSLWFAHQLRAKSES